MDKFTEIFSKGVNLLITELFFKFNCNSGNEYIHIMEKIKKKIFIISVIASFYKKAIFISFYNFIASLILFL